MLECGGHGEEPVRPRPGPARTAARAGTSQHRNRGGRRCVGHSYGRIGRWRMSSEGQLHAPRTGTAHLDLDLAADLDAELLDAGESQTWEAHLETCDRCTELLASIRGVRHGLATLPAVEPMPAGAAAALDHGARGERARGAGAGDVRTGPGRASAPAATAQPVTAAAGRGGGGLPGGLRHHPGPARHQQRRVRLGVRWLRGRARILGRRRGALGGRLGRKERRGCERGGRWRRHRGPSPAPMGSLAAGARRRLRAASPGRRPGCSRRGQARAAAAVALPGAECLAALGGATPELVTPGTFRGRAAELVVQPAGITRLRVTVVRRPCGTDQAREPLLVTESRGPTG